MESPSFRGLKLALRYKDSSIEKDVRWWEMGTLAIIGFIDLMLAAGLYLVYSNVRRELHLARLKSDFVANVSHELKTPLALIRLFAETLELGRVPSEEKAHQYYRVINKESHRLTQLINNILDFSRIEAGRKEYRFAPTDVARVVREVIESYRFQIEQQGFELKVDVADDLPQVPADEEALGQAIINLVNNAIKYSRESKTIHIAGPPRGLEDPRLRDRPRDRHPARRAQEDLREVLPRRGQPGARDEGQRPRPRPGAAHHGGPRRLGGGGEHPRQGQHLHPGPPGGGRAGRES